MSEEEWLVCEDPEPMLWHLYQRASERKLRLSDCACGWQLEPWFPIRELGVALRRSECFADQKITKSTLNKWHRKVAEVCSSSQDPKAWMASKIVRTACLPHDLPHLRCGMSWAELHYPEEVFGSRKGYFSDEWLLKMKHTAVCAIRDIFGNPFRPVIFNPTWRTHTVSTLAYAIYDEKEFGRLPILADALQDAGCDNERILSHCRREGFHVRGCWVVDLALNKS